MHDSLDGDGTERPCRSLWIQVITQAKEDLEGEPANSILYDQAAAFFIGGGQWAESRGIIADLLEMHPDVLFRCGHRWIAERRSRDGLPPELPPVPRAVPGPRTTAPPPLPRLEALPGPGTRQASRARRENAWITAKTRRPSNDANQVKDKDNPAGVRHRAVRRPWYDIPGATNPFAPHQIRADQP